MRRPSDLRSRRIFFGATLVALVLLFSGCADNGPQDFLNYQSGPNAEKADNLWDVTFLIAAVPGSLLIADRTVAEEVLRSADRIVERTDGVRVIDYAIARRGLEMTITARPSCARRWIRK